MTDVAPYTPALITGSVAIASCVIGYLTLLRQRRVGLHGPLLEFRKSRDRMISTIDDLHLTGDENAVHLARSRFHDAAQAIEIQAGPWVQKRVNRIDELLDQIVQRKSQWFDADRQVRPHVAQRYAELSSEARAIGDQILRRFFGPRV